MERYRRDSGAPRGRPSALQQLAKLANEPGDFRFGNVPAIDLDPLAEADQMRGGKQSYSQTGRAIDAFKHGAGRAFSVRASDMDETQSVVRIAGQMGELKSVFQAEFCAEPAQAIEKIDRLGIGHCPSSVIDQGVSRARKNSFSSD